MTCRALILLLVVLTLSTGHAAAQGDAAPAPAPAPASCGTIGEEKWGDKEAACLRELRGRVSRKGEVLTIRLENGKPKTYKNDQKACDSDDAQHCISYILIGYHPESRVYAIGIFYYEGSSVELLSARTGATLGLRGIPYFTPDGSRFVAIDNDEAYGGEHALSIGSAMNGELSLQWESPPPNLPREWRFERWVDNDHVAMQVFPVDGAHKCPVDDCKAFLVRYGDGWIVRPSPLPW